MPNEKYDLNNDFFDKLGVPAEKRKEIVKKLNEKLSYVPKIGIFGKTGVGKSSLCNALFGQDICEISDIESCTRNPQEVLLSVGNKGLTLLDVPGVGESQDRDKEYGELYKKLLPELDLVLWVLKADDRAFSSDELFYKNIVEPHIEEGKPFFFVINQVDKVEPCREWNEDECRPGPKQLDNIDRKVEVVSNIFGRPKLYIIPVSANEKYGLTALVDAFIFALPRDKKYTVGRNVSKENISERAANEIKNSWWETVVEVVGEFWEGAKDLVRGVVDGVKTIVENIWDIIKPRWWPW